MVYVDPKDQKIVTDDGVLYKAWDDRKRLRHQHFVMAQEIAELDKFISMYVARVQPSYTPEFSQIGVTISTNSAQTGCLGVTSIGDE